MSDNNTDPIVNQNTEPVNTQHTNVQPERYLSVDEWVNQYKAGTLPSLNIEMPNNRTKLGGETFSDATSIEYDRIMKEFNEEQVKEEFDNVFSTAHKFLDATLANATAAIWDTVGAFDIGDWRVPEMLGVGTALNEGFKIIDNTIGDGEDEVGNWFTRRADLLRTVAAKNSTINLGTGWLDGLDYVLNTSANVIGSVGGFVVSGLGTGGIGAALRIPKLANTLANAWLMTEATGLSIAEGVYNRVYDEVAGKLDPTYQIRLDRVYQEALEQGMKNNLFALDAEAAAQEAVRQFKKEFDAQNPNVGKIARESAAKGADASVKAAAPLFLLNITTAGLFTKGLYNPRNILSAPSRVSAKTILTEGGQEFAEEGIFERRAEDFGYNVGVKGSYTNEDLWNTIVNYDTLESGLIGFISGGLMGGITDAATYKDRNEKYNTQQERIKEENRIGEIVGKPELIDEVTTLQKNISQVVEMGKQADRLSKEGKTEEARALTSRMLAVQAAEAFKAGTTENLIANYEKIAKDPSAKVEVKQKATEAVAQIKEMEGLWKKTMGKYDNDVEVFFNRVNKLELGKAQKELGVQIAEQKILANEAVQAALKKGETSLTADIVERTIDEYNNVVADEKVVGQKELDYDLNNLKDNPYTDAKEKNVYDNFRSHVTKNVEAVRQLVGLQERLENIENNLADNETTYNKITSPEYKKSLKNEKQLYKVFKAGQAELESKEGTDEYMPLVNQIMKKYKNSILPERFELIKNQLDYKNEVVKAARTLSKTQAITNRYGKDDDADPVLNLDTNNGMTAETGEPKVNNSVMLNSVASKLATGRKDELTAEENEFLVTYAQQVQKKVLEIQQDPNAASSETLVDDTIEDDYKELVNDLEQLIPDADLTSEPTAQTLSPNETASLVEAPTLNAQEQAALDSFKSEVKKPILHRTIGPNYKSVISSLIEKGLITETNDSYVKAGETVESNQNSPAQNTLNNILSSNSFIATEEGLVLQLKEPTKQEEKESFNDAIALLKDKIKDNQLSGYKVTSFKDPFSGVTTFKIIKPITQSFIDTSEDAVSAQPNSYNEEGVSVDKKEEIKNIVSSYVENMEEANSKFPTFEEFIRHFAKVAGKTKADKYFHVLHSGWKMNKYPEVINPMAIWENIFQDYTTLADRLSELADEVSTEGRTLDDVKKQTDNQAKVDDLNSDRTAVYQDPDTKEMRYTSNSYTSEDTRSKVAYTLFESTLKYDVSSEEDQTVVSVEYDNQNQKLKERGLINPFVLLNYNEVKAGTEFEVVIPNERDLMSMVMPVRYESGPLKNAIQTDESGKRLTTTFGEWLKVKLESNPDFKSTQEYLDRVPMLLRYKGEYVGAVHETVWYNETTFRGNINEAQSNLREIRKGAVTAFNNGKSFNVRVSEVRGGVYEPLKLKTPKKIVDANPQAHVGIIAKTSKDTYGFFVNGKLFTPKIINMDNVLQSFKDNNKSPNNVPIDVRPWGLDENGDLVYKAFPSAKMPITKEQQDTVFNTLYALLTIRATDLSNAEKTKARSLQNKIQNITNLDITNFKDLGNFLKQFIIMPNLTPGNLDKIKDMLAKGTEQDLATVGQLYANLRNNSFKVNGQIPAGKIGLPYIILQAGTDNVTNIIYGKTGDSEAMIISPKDFGSDVFNAKLKELKDGLQAYELNVGTSYNGPVVYVDDNLNPQKVSNNYSEFLRNNLYTFMDSINIGTADNPMYVTRMQPTIHIEPSSTVSRKENQVSVSTKEVSPKDQQKNTLVAETSTQEDFKEAVVKAEEEGWKFQGDTIEEKADDFKKVVEENNAESTELVNDYLEAKETSIEQTEEFNKLVKQAQNQVKWVNEYFNNDGSVNQSFQPAELSDTEVEAMDKDVMKIKGLLPNHQSELAHHITIEIAQAIKQDEKIDIDKLRADSKNNLSTLLNANKELLQETLAKLKAVPDAENIAAITNLINKYEYALAKIDLVLENSDIIFDQALAFVLKDSSAKLVEDKIETKEKDERVVDDQDNIDTEQFEEGFSYDSENTIGNENYSKTSLEENHKSSISFELRRFMRGIQEVNPKTKAFELGAMGVPLYVGFDSVFDTLQSILADSPMDFATMMDILERNQDKQPWIPQVIERLKGSSNEIKNQFVTTMGKHALNMEFLMYSFDKDGKVQLRVTNTNSSAVSIKVAKEWKNNLLNSPLVNDDKTVNYNVAKQLYDVYQNWMFTLPEVKSKLSSTSLVPAISQEVKKGSSSKLLKEGGFSFTKDTRPKDIPASTFDELVTNLKEDKKVTVNGLEYRVSTDGNKITISPLKKSLVAKAISNNGAFIQLSPVDQQEVIDSVQEWLSMFGIELADNAIRHIFENGFMHKKSVINITEFFTFTESGGGVVGLLGNWLNRVVSSDPENTIDITLEKNNPLDNSAILKTLAFFQGKYTTDVSTTSFRDGKKSIYGFTAFKFITDRAKELTTNKQFRDNLRETSFAKNSMWLNFFNDFDTINKLNFEDIFSVSHLGLTAIKELGTKVYRDNGITALSDIDHEYTKIGLFQDPKQGKLNETYGGNRIGLRVARFLFPTMSDKSTMTIVKTLALNLADRKFYNVNEEGKLIPNQDILRILFEQLVLPEAQRIATLSNSKERQTNIKNYDKGAKMFLFLPKLNTLTVNAEDQEASLVEVLNTPGVDINKVFNKENEEKIFKELETYITSLVDNKVNVWTENGYITPKGEFDYENNLLDNGYWNDIKDSTIADAKVNSKDKAYIAAFDFEINQLLSNVNAFMTMIGDPALYYKVENDSQKTYIQKSKETFDNVGKRLAAMIAPGSKLADSENETYTQIFLADRQSIAENIEFLTKILDNKTFDREGYNKILSEKSNSNDPQVNEKFELDKKSKIKNFLAQYPKSSNYFSIESTDAQEYTTWQEHLHILEKLGRLNDATVGITPEEIREAKQMFANEVPLDKMSNRQKDILKKVLQPIKPVYTGQVFDKEQDVMRMVYIKSSSFPLIPQVTKGLGLDNLRMLLESIQEEGNTENNSPRKYVRASYQTANKVGAIAKPLSLFDEEGNIRKFIKQNEDGKPVKNDDGKLVYNTEEALKASLVLNRKDFKIQLDVPYKSLKRDADTISMGTQLTKLLFGNGIMGLDGFEYNGKPITGKALQEEFTKVFSELADLKKEQLYNELGIDVKTGQPIDLKETFNKLQKLLKDEAVNRGYSKQAIESLELEISNIESELMSFDDVRFKMPLWLSPNSDKFESLLNAIVSNRLVKIKMSGNSYVAASEEGFKFQTDLEGIEENKIVWTSKWNGRELQGTKYDGEGKLQYAQVLAPSKFRKQDGTLIDLLEFKNGQYTYVTETESGFKLKEDMIDSELMSLTSFRIPTSGHMSASQIEIVGFLPQEVGDKMVVPKTFTTQKGLDFDVDKENTYQLWHTTDENGKISILKQGDKEKLLQNKIINIHKSVLSNPSKAVQKKINGVLTTEYAEDQAKQIDTWLSEAKDDQYFTALSSEYQKKKLISAASGKLGTGAYSLDVTSHSLFEQAKANGNPLIANAEVYDITSKKTKPIPFVIGWGKEEGTSKGVLGNEKTIDEERTIAEVLSELQNIAVDNEKLQVMGKVNLNSYTLDVSKAIAMLGFDKSKVTGNSIQFTFLSQPILLDYVREMANADSNLVDFSINKQEQVIAKLLEKYGNKYYQLGYEKDIEESVNLSIGALESQLQSDTIDNGLQLAVLNRFLELNKIGGAIRGIQTTINIDSKGLSKSIAENTEKINSIIALSGNPIITNADKLIGDIIPSTETEILRNEGKLDEKLKQGYIEFGTALIKPTTISGTFAVNALSTADKLWSRHFPYNSPVVNAVISQLDSVLKLGEASEIKKAQKRKQIINEMKKYLNTDIAAQTIFKNTDAQAERQRLFMGDATKDSLASYIKEILVKYPAVANNKLIQRLEFEINKDGNPSFIKFNNASNSIYDEDFLNNALLDLMQKNITLDSFNNEPYTSRKLAQDLISYSMLEGGVQEAIQFVKFAPLAYLDAKGFTQGMRNIDFNGELGFNKFGINPDAPTKLGIFTIQFAQNNPQLLPKLDTLVDKRKAEKLAKFSVFSEIQLGANRPDLISFRVDQNYVVYLKQGKDYIQIPRLGTFGMAEYNNKPGITQSVINTAIPAPIVTPKVNEALNPVSEASKVTNQQRYDLDKSNLRLTLNKIADDKTIPESLSALAKALLGSISDSTLFRVEDLSQHKAKGIFKRSANEIGIDIKQVQGASDTELARTILKEAVHSVTDTELLKYVDGNNELKTNNAPPHILALIKLFHQIQRKSEFQAALQSIQQKRDQKKTLSYEEGTIYYGGYNILEFVEMILTQPEFQQEMAKVKTADGKTILSLFKDFFTKLFNALGIEFENDTVAAQAIENALILIDEKGKVKKEPQVQTQPVSTQQTQPTTTEVSNPVKNDLISIFEKVTSISANEVQLVDNIDFNEFENYPNILDYLNNDLGIEVLEYTTIKNNKDVIEDLLFEMEGDKNIYTLLDKLKSETDRKDLGLSSEVQPILTAPTSKEQDLLRKTENDPALKDYELLPGVTANEKQTEAIDKLNNFVRTPRDSSEKYQSTFVLTGAAGTGKTTIVKKIIDSNPGKKVVGAALSNSAKKVLGKSLGMEANTIASLIGIKLQADGSFDVDKNFEAKDSELFDADIIIIDEASMLSKEMLKLIYRIAPKNAKIIFMGDKAQLPPFKEDQDSKSFELASKSEYSANLVERMRQGETSPIVGYSDILRNETEKQNPRRTAIQRRTNNFDYTTNKGILFASKRQMNENMILDFKADPQNTKIITHSNKSRKQMNDIARLILWGKVGIENEYNIGEVLTANGTNPILKVTNGDFYVVKDSRKIQNAITINTGLGNKTYPGYELTLEVRDSDFKNNIIIVKVLDSKSQQDVKAIQDSLYKSGNGAIAGKNKEKLVDIDYGYALTAYKAQGTTLNNVYVIEDDIVDSPMTNKQVNQALYVAMTRAKNKAVIYSKDQLTQDDIQGMQFEVSLQPASNEMYENQIDELTRKGIIKSKCD